MGIAVALLQVAAELLKGIGDVVRAERVEAILADMPSLTSAESAAFKRAAARLAKHPA
jgi:uncharacterized protein (DUF362 family)